MEWVVVINRGKRGNGLRMMFRREMMSYITGFSGLQNGKITKMLYLKNQVVDKYLDEGDVEK